MSKSKALAVAPSDQAIQALRESFPMDQGFQRILLPRLSMASQDKTEGKGKAMKVVTEAGTFFTEKQTDEVNEEGKNVWAKEELGSEIEVVIIYKRKQLRLYDEATEKYTSSPIFDKEDEIIPLFCDKVEVARGTMKELKAKYQYKGEDGKTKSKLEDNAILYVIYNDEIHQMNLRGSSMYSYLAYTRKVLPPVVLTSLSSEAKEKGSIAWNQMTFEAIRNLTAEEVVDVQDKVNQIRNGILAEKEYYSSLNEETTPAQVVGNFGDFPAKS